MKLPPGKETGALLHAPKTAELLQAYRLLAFLQAPFAFVFWKIEQAKARLEDWMEKERNGR